MSIAEMIADELWKEVEKLLPVKEKGKGPGGRPQSDERKIFSGIIYILRTGSQWGEVPRIYGTKSTVHRYFQQWTEAGVFTKLWEQGLQRYDQRQGIDYGRLVMER